MATTVEEAGTSQTACDAAREKLSVAQASARKGREAVAEQGQVLDLKSIADLVQASGVGAGRASGAAAASEPAAPGSDDGDDSGSDGSGSEGDGSSPESDESGADPKRRAMALLGAPAAKAHASAKKPAAPPTRKASVPGAAAASTPVHTHAAPGTPSAQPIKLAKAAASVASEPGGLQRGHSPSAAGPTTKATKKPGPAREMAALDGRFARLQGNLRKEAEGLLFDVQQLHFRGAILASNQEQQAELAKASATRAKRLAVLTTSLKTARGRVTASKNPAGLSAESAILDKIGDLAGHVGVVNSALRSASTACTYEQFASATAALQEAGLACGPGVHRRALALRATQALTFNSWKQLADMFCKGSAEIDALWAHSPAVASEVAVAEVECRVVDLLKKAGGIGKADKRGTDRAMALACLTELVAQCEKDGVSFAAAELAPWLQIARSVLDLDGPVVALLQAVKGLTEYRGLPEDKQVGGPIAAFFTHQKAGCKLYADAKSCAEARQSEAASEALLDEAATALALLEQGTSLGITELGTAVPRLSEALASLGAEVGKDRKNKGGNLQVKAKSLCEQATLSVERLVRAELDNTLAACLIAAFQALQPGGESLDGDGDGALLDVDQLLSDLACEQYMGHACWAAGGLFARAVEAPFAEHRAVCLDLADMCKFVFSRQPAFAGILLASSPPAERLRHWGQTTVASVRQKWRPSCGMDFEVFRAGFCLGLEQAASEVEVGAYKAVAALVHKAMSGAAVNSIPAATATDIMDRLQPDCALRPLLDTVLKARALLARVAEVAVPASRLAAVPRCCCCRRLSRSRTRPPWPTRPWRPRRTSTLHGAWARTTPSCRLPLITPPWVLMGTPSWRRRCASPPPRMLRPSRGCTPRGRTCSPS